MRGITVGLIVGCVLAVSVASAQPRSNGPRGEGRPGAPGTLIQPFSGPVETAAPRARALVVAGREAEALAFIDRLPSRVRSRPDVGAVRAIARFSLLGVALEPGGARTASPPAQRELGAILATLTRWTSTQPEDSRAWLALGRVRLVRGDLAGADTAFESATRADASEPQALNDRAMVLVALRRLPEAERALLEATRRAARDAEPWSNLGAVRLARGDATGAIEAFRQAIELDPGRARFHADLGSALLAASETEAAIASYRRALGIATDDAVVLANLGYALSLANRLDEAVESLRRATTLAPRSVTAWNNLGAVLARRGESAEARSCFERARALDPEDPRARANLEALGSRR